jgi:hypothetical protein
MTRESTGDCCEIHLRLPPSASQPRSLYAEGNAGQHHLPGLGCRLDLTDLRRAHRRWSDGNQQSVSP